MPIHKNPDGTWQWGNSGKKYRNKEDAVKQMKAIFANGYVEKKASSLLQVLSGDKLTDLQAKRILALIIKLHRDHNKYLKQEPVSSIYKSRKLKYIKSPDTRIITDNPDKPNYVGMVLQLSDDPKGVRWLSSLYVKPLLRGRGIGEAIINQALKDSRLLGSLRLKIDYYAANPASRLYLRLGYKPQLIIALKLLNKKAALSLLLLKLKARPYYLDKRWNHIQLVLATARQVKGSKLTPVLNAAIIYHDVAKRDLGALNHGKNGAIIALKDLKDKYTPLELLVIVKAIQLHNLDLRINNQKLMKQLINLFSTPLGLLLAIADDARPLDPEGTWDKVLSYNFKNTPDRTPTLLLKHIQIRLNPKNRMPKLNTYSKLFTDLNKPFILWLLNLDLKTVADKMQQYKENNV